MAVNSVSSIARLELLSKDNFDTWSMQVEALLTKNDLWGYVSGACSMPDDTKVAEQAAWIKSDNKARADLILSIQPSELKHIRGCATSRSVWTKLESVYASKGPARKATLLKKLMLHKLDEGGEVKDHIAQFFDTVDKLENMSVNINGDLLTIMLLYSLPSSFDNFRCAIESRDELPSSDVLKSKIIEEYEARKQSTGSTVIAMNVGTKSKKIVSKFVKREFRCFKCGTVGHKASVCPTKGKNSMYVNKKMSQDIDTYYTADESANFACRRSDWILDSGCTTHLCSNDHDLAIVEKSSKVKINMANQASAQVMGEGDVQLCVNNGCGHGLVNLKNVLYVPDLRTNLISVAKIVDKDCKVIFSKRKALVYNANNDLTLIAEREGDLFYVRQRPSCAVVDSASSELVKWHLRMGHLNLADLVRLMHDGIIPSSDLTDANAIKNCEICLKGKMSALPFHKNREPCEEALNIVYSDVVGPFRIQSHEAARYFVTFIDDYSRWSEIYFLREKGGVLNAFKTYKNMIELRTGKRIKNLHSDNGGEYINGEFDQFLAECGIQRRLTIAQTPQQNGVAERLNRTLLDMARCLLFQSGLGPSFWARAVAVSSYVRNRCPTVTLKWLTPYEKLFRAKPNVAYFRNFGCKVMMLDKSQNKSKLAPRAVEGVFVGYPKDKRGYMIWLPHSRQVVCARDVKFFQESICDSGEKCDIEQLLVSYDSNTSSVEICELPVTSDASGTTTQPDDTNKTKKSQGRPKAVRTGARGRPRKVYQLKTVDTIKQPVAVEEVVIQPVGDYETKHHEAAEFVYIAELDLHDALNGPDVDEWMSAIETEVVCLLKNETWCIEELSDPKNVVGCRFVLTNKCGPDGKVERRKARLVAKGYSQKIGIDYHKTFAPVARLESLRLLLALTVQCNFSIWQFDIVTAYLHGLLEERVIMKVPDMLGSILERIIKNHGEQTDIGMKAIKMQKDLAVNDNAVCVLRKALYGLRQAGRQWYSKISSKLNLMGLNCTSNEPCFFHGTVNGENVWLLLYVDDFLVSARTDVVVHYTRDKLSTNFEVKDLGMAKYCLGLEIEQSTDYIKISQMGYINQLLRQYGMYGCNSVLTPADGNFRCDSDSKPYLDRNYRTLIGALMYLCVSTRPDIANIISKLAQFVNNPLDCHWLALKRILRYLSGTSTKGLIYKKTETPLSGYADADWGGCAIDRRSYSGYVFLLGGAAISWKSKKQQTVALSSTEAEYISLSEAAKEALYLCSLLSELGQKLVNTVVIYVDNKGAMCLANNPVSHGRTKHIDIKHHFLRECVESGSIMLKHVPTQYMLADFLTKCVSRVILERCLKGIGLCP